MARTLTYLEQEALQQVHTLNLEKRRKREEVEALIRERTAAELADLERSESLAVHRALALGISKAQVGREGLHTRDPYAIARVLEVTDAADAPTPAFRVLTPAERERYSIADHIIAAHVTYGDATGIATRDEHGWVLLDGDDMLTDELDGGPVAGLLDAWTR